MVVSPTARKIPHPESIRRASRAGRLCCSLHCSAEWHAFPLQRKAYSRPVRRQGVAEPRHSIDVIHGRLFAKALHLGISLVAVHSAPQYKEMTEFLSEQGWLMSSEPSRIVIANDHMLPADLSKKLLQPEFEANALYAVDVLCCERPRS
jgi:hypothetical protein